MTTHISHHILLCATPRKAKCCESKLGSATWDRLKSLINELNLEDPRRPEGIVLRSKVDCLRVCEKGPILLIWPDGIWYAEVTPYRLEKIIKDHIIKGLPKEDWIIKKTPQNLSN